MSKFSEYIRKAYKYYEEETSICPDAEDIINDVIYQIEDNTGIELDDNQLEQLEKEVKGV